MDLSRIQGVSQCFNYNIIWPFVNSFLPFDPRRAGGFWGIFKIGNRRRPPFHKNPA